MSKSAIIYIMSIVILVVGCIAFTTTGNYVIRNIFLGVAYILWGIIGILVVKEAFE